MNGRRKETRLRINNIFLKREKTDRTYNLILDQFIFKKKIIFYKITLKNN